MLFAQKKTNFPKNKETPRQPPPPPSKKKHVCQGAIYLSKSKMTPQNKMFVKKKIF